MARQLDQLVLMGPFPLKYAFLLLYFYSICILHCQNENVFFLLDLLQTVHFAWKKFWGK